MPRIGKTLTRQLVSFAQRKSLFVIIFILLLTCVFGFFALRIRIDTEVLRLLPDDFEANVLIDKYAGDSKDVEYVFLVISGKDIFSTGKLKILDDVITAIESIDAVQGSISPFNLPVFQKDGTRLTIRPLSEKGRAPATEDELRRFAQNISTSPLAKNLVISEDGSSLCIIFPIQVLENYDGFLNQFEIIVSELDEIYTTYIAGWIPLHDTIQKYILKDSPRLIAVAIAIILLIFFLSFGTLRAVSLPFLAVSIGMIWTLGIMSLLGMPLSIVSIMTPVLIIALGSSYSIHILNQYYHEADPAAKDGEWLTPALCHISRTIVLASFTTAIGFGSLIAATVERIRQFGIATGIGVLICALLAMFLYPAFLSRLRYPKAAHIKRISKGILAGWMRFLGFHIKSVRYIAALFFVVVAVIFVFSLRHVRYETDYTSYFRERVTALEDNRFLMDKFGGFMYLNLTMTAPGNEKDYFRRQEILEKVSRFEDELLENPDITHVTSLTHYLKAMNFSMNGEYSYPENRAMVTLMSRFIKTGEAIPEDFLQFLANDDFTRLTFQIRMYDSDEKWFLFEERLSGVVSFIRRKASELLPSQTNPELWGWNLVALELSQVLIRDQIISIVVSAVLVFLVAIVTFRSFAYGAFCLVPLVMGIMLNFILMWILNIPFDVFTIMFSSVAIGAGIDDSIHLLIQFRRFSRIYPEDRQKAISLSVGIAGRPILLTSISVITGLLALTFSSFVPVVYFGLLVSLALLSTTLGALLFLPAFLSFERKASSQKLRLKE